MEQGIRWWIGWAVLPLAAMTVGACGKHSSPGEAQDGTGTLQTSVSVALRSGPAITSVQLDIDSAGITEALLYNSSTGLYTNTVTVPVGSYTVRATAWSTTNLVGTGTADVTVALNEVAAVSIHILQTQTPVTFSDSGPIITSLTASKVSPATGESITLRATAVDADNDPITFHWTQVCDGGVFSIADGPEVAWSDPEIETCFITVTATSKTLTDTAQVTIDVQEATGTLSVQALFIRLPYVMRIALAADGYSCAVARTATDASCRPALAASTPVTATVTFDPMPEGSATVVLSDNCGGAVGGGTFDLPNGTASFPWTAPASPATCMLTAAITRETLYDAQRIAVAVR